MTAPDHAIKPIKNHLHEQGHPYMNHKYEISEIQILKSRPTL